MTEIEQARTELLAMPASPGVSELAAILSSIELDVNVGHAAGAIILQGGGSFVELLEALMRLRSTLESLRDRYREYESTVDRMYWNKTAPGPAAELVLHFLRARLRAIDDLIWNLPSPRRRHIEG